jgi:hypothetical protein
MNFDLFLEMFTVERSHFLVSWIVYWQLLLMLYLYHVKKHIQKKQELEIDLIKINHVVV